MDAARGAGVTVIGVDTRQKQLGNLEPVCYGR
jgi:hypothetical protein